MGRKRFLSAVLDVLKTKIFELGKKENLDQKDLDFFVETLSFGGLVIFPTDTVYGLACNAFHPEAIHKIYQLKGRSYTKALPIFIADPGQLSLVAKEVLPEAHSLIKAFWPGALTLVFKTAPLAMHAARGKGTLAVRIPKDPLLKKILAALPFPLAVTSANRSGRGSLSSGTRVKKQFEGKVDVIIDGGECEIGRESTVVDVTHFPFLVVREGAISKQKILNAI